MAESLPIPFREAGSPANVPPLLLFFSEEAVENEAETRAQGMPIFDSAVMCRVAVAGNNGDAPVYEIERTGQNGERKISDQLAYYRFREPFEAWKKGQLPANTGTPLEQWPLMTVALVATMKAQNIFTIQQLAEVSDASLDKLRGLREWREKAKAWVSSAKDAAGDVEARAENARLAEQVKALQAQVSELLTRQNTPGYDAPKRGRKKTESSDVEITLPGDDPEDARL